MSFVLTSFGIGFEVGGLGALGTDAEGRSGSGLLDVAQHGVFDGVGGGSIGDVSGGLVEGLAFLGCGHGWRGIQ